MQYVEICGPSQEGKSICKCVFRLVMGTDHLGNVWEHGGFLENENQTSYEQRKKNSMRILDYAYSKGLNFFDTSPIYGDGIENTLVE
jgi:aryl-alcohol dehydrogenase-like predicted oxidoreductase